MARKFSGRGVETEDLEQVAGMALLKALERFDPSRGFRFVTYAVPTITGDVRNYLRDKSGLMRMPRDMRQRLYQMTQEKERFEREQSSNAYRCGTVRAHGNRARGVPGFARPAHAK